MSLLKKVLTLGFFLGSLPAGAITYLYEELPKAARPKQVVKISYADATRMVAPSNGRIIPDTLIHEVTTDPIYRTVTVTFCPNSPVADVEVSTGFPIDIAELVLPFLQHLSRKGGTARSFMDTYGGIEAFSRIDATMTSDVYINGTTPKQIIGQRTLIPLQTPDHFFIDLERTIQEVRAEGCRQTCKHNPGLMSFMRSILHGDSLEDITYENLRHLAQLFGSSGLGFFKKDTKKEFTFRSGKLRVTFTTQSTPKDSKEAMADFIRRAFPQGVLQFLESFQSEGNVSSSTATSSAAEGVEKRCVKFNDEESSTSVARGGASDTKEDTERDSSAREAEEQEKIRVEQEAREVREKATTTIQSVFRSYKVREKEQVRQRQLEQQRLAQEQEKARLEQEAREKERKAATTIQSVFRSYKAREKEQVRQRQLEQERLAQEQEKARAAQEARERHLVLQPLEQAALGVLGLQNTHSSSEGREF